MNYMEYIKKYGNMSFLEKPFNEIDASIFSLIAYMNLGNNDGFLKELLKNYISSCSNKQYYRINHKNRLLIELANLLIDCDRYKDIYVSDIVSKITLNEQFKALSFRVNNMLIVSFEGTDETLIGWEEDMALSYSFPVVAETDAMNYINRVVRFCDKKVYITGHSKGGHLALIAGMYSNIFTKMNLKKIYSFDGPGLNDKQLNSWKYKSIEKKFYHFVPDYSLIGMLLKHKKIYVVKGTRKDTKCHSLFSWIIDDDHFEEGTLSNQSTRLYSSINSWLEHHNVYERENISKEIFRVFRTAGLVYYQDLYKIKNIIKILMNSRNMDKYTIRLLKEFIQYNLSEITKKDTNS